MRIHAFATGFALLLIAALIVAGPWHLSRHAGLLLGITGVWLVAKDWNDLFASRRNTTRWSVALHRRVHPLRTWRRAAWFPAALGAILFAGGFAVAGSALLPGSIGGTDLAALLGSPVLEANADVLRLPLGLVLMVIAVPVARRRRRAWPIAAAALSAIVLLDVLRAHAMGEAAVASVLVVATIVARGAFYVEPATSTLGQALRRVPLIAAGAYAASLIAVWAAAGHVARPVTWPRALTEAAAMLSATPGPIGFTGHMRWLPVAVGIVGMLGLIWIGWLISQPLRVPEELPDESAVRRGLEIVQADGADTLSFFKLRRDVQYLFSDDHRAFVAYRVRSGVLLVSGDPVGPDESVPGLIADAARLAERQGLRLAVLGAGQALADLYRDAGLRRVYLGDEAVVDTAAFTLEGRRIRKVRQSVNRLEAAGYRLSVRTLAEVSQAELDAFARVSEAWLGDDCERGFSMALDELGGRHQADTVVAVAHDGSGTIRGFLHFAPCYGAAAVSLASMRRERDTPNGFTEFMIARTIEALRMRGICEVSLNFVVFGRWMRAPRGRIEAILGRVVASSTARATQVASLYRFSAKFMPEWRRRDLWFEGMMGLPAAALASLRAEGQLPAIGAGARSRPSAKEVDVGDRVGSHA